MKHTSVTLILALILQFAFGQEKLSATHFYSIAFKWKITIPAGFEAVSAEQQKQTSERGKKALEQVNGEEIEDNVKPVFFFRSGQLSTIEANYQETNITEDYSKVFKDANDIVYQSFRQQLPNARLDSSYSTELIDGKLFHVFNAGIELDNDMKISISLYGRLFGTKNLSVNIMTVSNDKRRLLLDAWRNSKFGVN